MSAGYHYESAKDVLRWEKLPVRSYAKFVMSIGALVHLSDDDFEKFKNRSEYVEVDLEQLKKMYEE